MRVSLKAMTDERQNRPILSEEKKLADFCMSHDRFYCPILSADISAINLAVELVLISPRKAAENTNLTLDFTVRLSSALYIFPLSIADVKSVYKIERHQPNTILTARRWASFASAGCATGGISVMSVCPSVTLWYCVKTREHKGLRSSPSGSPVYLVFWCQEWLMGHDPVH